MHQAGGERMLVVGLTGGIASGKSTAAAYLKTLGAPLVDCDVIARKVVERGQPAFKAIMQSFGSEVLSSDGSLNRKRLGEIVFSNPALRLKLEEITHPFILAHMQQEIREHTANSRLPVIVDIPLLYENNLGNMVDLVVLVYAPYERQLERLMHRDGFDEKVAKLRLKAQMPIEKKRALADYVVDNTGSIEQLKAQVDALWKELKEIANRTHCP